MDKVNITTAILGIPTAETGGVTVNKILDLKAFVQIKLKHRHKRGKHGRMYFHFLSLYWVVLSDSSTD